MRITAVLGSPTRNGNTCVLAREVLRGASDAGAETEEIFLTGHHIEYCKGCIGKTPKHCMSTGKCNINDDVEELKQKLYHSDGIVLASPSYGIMPSAVMKNFITDRIGMFTAYTSSFGGKYFAGVSTCGGIGATTVAKNMVMDFVAGFHRRSYVSGYLGVKLAYGRIESNPEALAKAYRLGRKLAQDIERKKSYPFQGIKNRMLINLIVKRIILKNIFINKDGEMKAVFQKLVECGTIKLT
jgi:multimeric flavodoxin WrbA